MKFLFLVLLLIPFIYCEIETDSDGVLILTQDNFDDALKAHEHLMVEFYAPWCGHCKSLAPEWGAAAKTLGENDPAMFLGKVDATENRDLGSEYDVTGYPTILFFKDGQGKKYDGPRESQGIVNWYLKKTGPAAKTVTASSEVDSLQETNEVVVMGLFADVESETAKNFLKVAGGFDDVMFTIGSVGDLGSAYDVTSDTVVVLKDFDEKRNDLAVSGDTSTDEMTTFIQGSSTPLVITFTPAASSKIFGSNIEHHFLFFTDVEADYHENVHATVKTVATEKKGELLFVNVPASESKVADYFGFQDSDYPVGVLVNVGAGTMKKYFYDGDMSDASAIGTYIGDYFDGKLSPNLKSAEPSDEDDKGPVQVLVGKNFNDKVINNDKDVIVEFYAPWCGHCKKLAPIWDELGEALSEEPNIVVAKIDSTANEVDVEGVSVGGFPTIYFFKGNEKDKPKKYNGGREYDALVEYIKKNAAHSITKEL